MSTRVLITGGAGFIGCRLGLALAADPDVEIAVTDDFRRGHDDDTFRELCRCPNVTFIAVDLCDSNAVAALPGPFGYIYHLAAMVGVARCMSQPYDVLCNNIRSTLNVVELARRWACRKLLFASTSEVYAGGYALETIEIPTDERVPVVIDDVTNPRTTYAASKIVGEQMIMHGCPLSEIEYVIVRLHNVYGPRMGYAHVIPEVIRRTVGKEDPMRVYGHDQTRAFCYVDDAVAGMRAVMDNASNEIIHIGTGEETGIADLYEMVLSRMGHNPERIPAPAPVGSVARRCPDVSRIRKLTGWKPNTTLAEGLETTCLWYQADLHLTGAAAEHA